MEINYSSLLPEIILSLTGVLVMLLVSAVGRDNQAKLGYLAVAGVLLALLATLSQWGDVALGYQGMIFQDRFAQFSRLLFLIAIGAISLVSISYLQRERIYKGEYFSLLLFAAVGMSLMASSADLIMTFLGLETLSIATYVLAGYRREDMRSTESALKYFILGAFSTAFMLYGIALIYGATGSTKYLQIGEAMEGAAAPTLALLMGLGLLLVGFGFKAALVPFHVWTPDVYEGAPIPITSHLAVASKAAAIVALLRILFQVFPRLDESWIQLLWLSAVLTMLVGNLAALTQTNIKRMLAYSSIAHAGYLLIGVTAHNSLGAQGVLFYLMAYALMNVGAFTVIQILACKDERLVQIQDYSGLGFRYPFLSISLSVFMFSLAGIPLTAGFAGKLFLLAAAVQSQMYWLVVIAVIASAIGVYYYLRVLVVLFMNPEPPQGDRIAVPLVAQAVILLMVLGTLYLGIFPGPFLELASEAVRF